MRILFIEDDAMNRRVVRDMLSVAGLPLQEAENGADGIQQLADALDAGEPFDLLLLDLRMPGMDGFAVTEALRARDDALSTLPIIIVTADASPGLEGQCLECGADAVLHKPIAMQSLFDCMATILVSRTDPDTVIG